jgi:hypothetical protein
MSQSPALPAGFDPRWKLRTGLAVLENGLPELPGELDYRMSIPVAFWTAPSCAVVLFLEFSRETDGTILPRAIMTTYARDGDLWSGHKYHGGVGWSHDPIADPHGMRDLDNRAIVEGGGSFTDSPSPGHPAAVVVGRARPDVTHLALLQDGHEDRRALCSDFGAWVVCTEHWSPYQINALAENGAVLASLHGPPRLPSHSASSSTE